ncbi:hypothetical protein [Streptomyces sp. NRRL F-5053]|uniref:hypothetical protein n=1 Tax=Streptomyces sp. NRRL F-5053 TaxID=1463854 RepID=UPI0004C48653|nr:hypothetical protein [Streptomyces sp. NRRL F-5053]
MQCTHIDLSGDTPTDCGNEDFDVKTPVMLTVDLSSDAEDHTIELNCLSHEDIETICKKYGNKVEGIEFDKALTALVLKLEKPLGTTLQPFSSSCFEDGTEIIPKELTA